MSEELNNPDGSEYYTITNGTEVITGKLDPYTKVTTGLSGATIIHSTNYNEYLSEVDAAGVVYPDLPPMGTPMAKDEICHDTTPTSTGNVIVRQDHDRTEHDPSTVPALFMVYREGGDGILDWIPGEQVNVNDERTYDGETYQVIQGHVTQVGWEPPNVPALFQLKAPEPGPEWAPGVAYVVDDVAAYNAIEYRCLQPHTAQVGWEPPNVPALWSPVN